MGSLGATIMCSEVEGDGSVENQGEAAADSDDDGAVEPFDKDFRETLEVFDYLELPIIED